MAAAQQPSVEEVLRRLNLPTGGEFPFIPPRRWHPTEPLHGPSTGGYYDRQGRLWQKGRSVTAGQYFEWDVQLPEGGHVNVDWSGRVTHPRPKPRRGRKPKRR